jgi:hypothetical protein
MDRGRGGPGGWIILPEPEVHFPDPAVPHGVQVVDPDVDAIELDLTDLWAE